MREIAVQTSEALARFDADWLEALAAACEVLRSEFQETTPEQRLSFSLEARQAVQPMRNLERTLAATVANLDVLANLSELRAERLEYGGRRPRG